MGAHKRAGAGDPLEHAPRLWILLAAMATERPPAARKLGVTPEMLTWMCRQLAGAAPEKALAVARLQLRANRTVFRAATLFGFFFLCRASEYLKSGKPDFAKVLLGMDVSLKWPGGASRGEGLAERLDVQLRKTKTDQAAFGCVRTHYRVAGA